MRVNNSKLTSSQTRASHQSPAPAYHNQQQFSSYNSQQPALTPTPSHTPTHPPTPTPSNNSFVETGPFYGGLHSNREDHKQEQTEVHRNIANIPQLTTQQ